MGRKKVGVIKVVECNIQREVITNLIGQFVGVSYQGTGASLKLRFVPGADASCCCRDGKFRWYQTITHDDDPGKQGLALPRADVGLAPTYDNPFTDMPSIPDASLRQAYFSNRSKGAKITIRFKVEFQCENKNGLFKKLESIKWGFWAKADRNGNITTGLE